VIKVWVIGLSWVWRVKKISNQTARITVHLEEGRPKIRKGILIHPWSQMRERHQHF